MWVERDSGALLNSPANPLPTRFGAQNSAAGRHAQIVSEALKHQRFWTPIGRFSGAESRFFPDGRENAQAGRFAALSPSGHFDRRGKDIAAATHGLDDRRLLRV